jgi:hypothetical protein
MHFKTTTKSLCLYSESRVFMASFAIVWSAYAAPHAVAQYGGDFANAGFHDINSRLYLNDGDWAPGLAKGECGGDYPAMAGVSTSPDHLWAFSALCVPSPQVNPDAGRTISADPPPRQLGGTWGERSDTSTGDWFAVTSVGDAWDSVLECAANEVMTGVAQSTTQFFDDHNVEPRIWYARCSPMDRHVAADCQAVEFGNTNGYEDEEPGDWAPNYIKGTCGPNRYMKGIANRSRNDVNWHDGGIFGFDHHAATTPVVILCCSPALAGHVGPRF